MCRPTIDFNQGRRRMKTQETTSKIKAAKPMTKSAKAKEVQTKTGGPQKAAKSAKAKREARSGSKAETVLKMMRRKQGATLAEIARATDWQNHSIRGFVSGDVTKKMGLKV